jgi:hypothetical protein
MGWVVNATSRPIYPWERPGTHCLGDWVGPRIGLDSCGKSRPTRVRSPECPARSESLSRPCPVTSTDSKRLDHNKMFKLPGNIFPLAVLQSSRHICYENIRSFHWHVLNAVIPCRFQLLPFLSVIYFFLPLYSNYYSALPLAIYVLVYLLVFLIRNSYKILFWELYFLPFSTTKTVVTINFTQISVTRQLTCDVICYI